MIRVRIEVALGFLLTVGLLHAQQTSSPDVSQMTAKEAYTFAITPFLQARQAPDDLTDADKWAIAIGMSRAKEACAAIAPTLQDDENLFDEGKLCLFGQDFLTASLTLKRYVLKPGPASLEDGRLMLAQAFLGLGQVDSAESQMESLFLEFPYDAKIHLGIDRVIDAAEAYQITEVVAQRLSDQQISHTLETLTGSGVLTAKDNSATVGAALLVQDALRSARLYRETNSPDRADKIVEAIQKTIASSQYAHSSDLPGMQNAFNRYQSVGKKALEENLRGEKLLRTGPLKQVVRLPGKPCILLAFSLASPQSADMIAKLADMLKSKPALPIYAVTSFTANTGTEERSDAVLNSLRDLRNQLPDNVTVLVIPDVELQVFNIDSYPSGIVLSQDGVVRFVEPLLSGQGGLRRLVEAADVSISGERLHGSPSPSNNHSNAAAPKF